MPDTTVPQAAAVNAAAGHLYLHVDGAHPAEVPFLFEQQPRRLGLSVVASGALDVAFFVLLVFASRLPAHPVEIASVLNPNPNPDIIWTVEPGPGGGGGGGGNQMKEPPRKAEAPGKDKITVPVAKPPKLEEQVAKKEPNPVEQLNIPAQPLADSKDFLPGAIETPPGPPTPSQGSGTGGGAGTGRGTGIGPGTGSGLGPGDGGNTGGGAYQPGNGVTNPVVISEVKPKFTSDAMRAKVQGIASVACVVERDGSTSGCTIARSLDPTFGLDQEAVIAASKWRFRPGTLRGVPVRVQIVIEMAFTLR